MLNKELLLGGKPHADSSVVMTIGRLRTPGYSDEYGWSTYSSFGSLNKIPYWGEASLKSLTCVEYFTNFEKETAVSFDNSIPVELTIEINNKHFTLPKGGVNFSKKGDILGIFYPNEGKQVTVTFDPPPDGYTDP